MVPPGVMVVVWTTGVREDGAKKGEELPEDEEAGVDAAVLGVRGRAASGRPRRDERTVERRPIFF